jgi:hypothetical protein
MAYYNVNSDCSSPSLFMALCAYGRHRRHHGERKDELNAQAYEAYSTERRPESVHVCKYVDVAGQEGE